MQYELADREYGSIRYGIFPVDMGTVTVTPKISVLEGMPDDTIETYNYAALSTWYKLKKAPEYK